MNLHHTTEKPDWTEVNSRDRNRWQRLAAASHGVLTPANALTLLGFGLVLFGLVEIGRQHYWTAASLLLVGRALDVADGWIAEATHTKSPLGEVFDAGIDKLATLLIVIVFLVTSLAPGWLLAALALPHILIAFVAVIARFSRQSLHPSLPGKLSMGFIWLTLVGFVVLRALGTDGAGPAAWTIYCLAAVSIGLGMIALAGYATALRSRA